MRWVPCLAKSSDMSDALSRSDANKETALRFIESLRFGKLATELLAEDFKGWSGLSGEIPGDVLVERASVVGSEMMPDGINYVIHDTIAEGDCVAVRASANATTFEGVPYANDLHYFFRFNADGKLRYMAEYMNTQRALEVIRPAFEALARRKS
jgi:ketosteroid isomerase-like protein